MNPPPCPCGLTQEQLLAAPNQLLGPGMVCIAFRKDKSLNPDGSRAQCGELVADHPRAPSAATKTSPRLGNSVFVLLFNGTPIGTTFYVGNDKFVTAAHCVLEDDGSVAIGHWSFVSIVTRAAGRNVFADPPNPVQVCAYNKDADWAVLFSPTSISGVDALDICPLDQIPSMKDEPKFKLYHCPVSLYWKEFTTTIEACPKGWFTPLAIDTVHGILTLDYGGYKGSSGGVIVNQSGKAVAMYVESMNETETVADCKMHSPNDLDAVSLSADSATNSHSSCFHCVILSHFPELILAINS